MNINGSPSYPVDSSYLKTDNARANLKALTVADSTFILNTKTEVGLGAAKAPKTSKDALVFIKQGDYEKKYGFEVSVQTTAGTPASIEFTSVNNGVNFKIDSLDVENGGTGYSVDDIIDVAFSEKVIDDDDSDGDYTSNLTLYTQPTFKVTAVGSSGQITTAEVENEGNFKYQLANTTTYAYRFGLGLSFTESGTHNHPETLSVQSRSFGAFANLTFSSTDNGYYKKVNSLSVNNGGSGFAVGDIVNVPLLNPNSIVYDNDDGDSDPYSFPLTLLTQPTFKVTGVGSNGVITSAQMENEGQFRYRGRVQDSDYMTWDSFGLGTSFSEFGTRNKSQSFEIESTGNTTAPDRVDSLIKSYKSGDDASSIDSTYILARVALLTNNGTNHTSSGAWNTHFTTDTTKIDSNILILEGKNPTLDFTITPKDGLAGEGIGVVYKQVNSITELPLYAKNGFVVTVSGDAELNQDDYYVRFETLGGDDVGKGAWVETVAPDLPLNYDGSTLPIELVSEPDGFTLRSMKFQDRVAGDDRSNPLASFTGQTISNLFFYKNRLGFLSNENIILSESGLGSLDTTGQLVFNFGRNTVTTLLDSDPIDVAVASSRVTNLKAAKGFQENLVLFSEIGQFVLKGGDVLTPKTVSITPVTNFSFEHQVDPLPLGSYIYFPFTRGAFTGLREFTVNASTDNYDSSEVTEHVPAYIPNDIIDIAGTTSEDMIVLLSKQEKGSLYIYNYFWNNQQKVLSAWSKFTFTGEIRGIEFIESKLYAVITNNEQTHLVEMPMESGLSDAAGYVTHLDMRIANTVAHGTSTITLPYTPAHILHLLVLGLPAVFRPPLKTQQRMVTVLNLKTALERMAQRL